MDEPEFDIGEFKERLNNLMMQHGPGHLTINQCETIMCNFCAELERVQLRTPRPEAENQHE